MVVSFVIPPLFYYFYYMRYVGVCIRFLLNFSMKKAFLLKGLNHCFFDIFWESFADLRCFCDPRSLIRGLRALIDSLNSLCLRVFPDRPVSFGVNFIGPSYLFHSAFH